MNHIRNVMVQGLIVVIPLAVTFWVLRLVFNVLDGFLGPPIKELTERDVPGVGLMGMLLLFYFVGLVLQLGIGRKAVEMVQGWMTKIPIVGAVYRPAKQLIDSFTDTAESGFKKVVIIEYPKAGTWMIAFMTATTMTNRGEMGVVYVPTAPTPNSGWVGVVPMEDVYSVDMSVQQAMSMVLSGGIDTPKNIDMNMDSSESQAKASGDRNL